MIANKAEYQIGVERVVSQEQRLIETRQRLADEGLNPEEIKRATDPLVCFMLGVKEEIEDYNKRGNTNLSDK